MKQPEKVKPAYISNPFNLVIPAMRRLFKSNRSWAIALLILGILSTIDDNWRGSGTGTSGSTRSGNFDELSLFVLAVLIISTVAIVVIIILVISTYIQGMLSYVALQSEKGKSVSFKEASQASQQRFWKLLGAQLLAALKVLGWSLLFILPGIVAAFRYSLLSYVVMDEPAEESTTATELHERVKTLTKSRMWEVAAVSFTSFIPGIGWLLDLTGKAAQYNQLKYFADKNLKKPKINWVNYFFTTICTLLILAALTAIGILFYKNLI